MATRLTALLLAMFAFASAARADDPQPLAFQHALSNGQPVLLDVNDDIKADLQVDAWDKSSVDVTVEASGQNSDSVRLSGSIENGTLAMHVIASPSPHKGFLGWLGFYRPKAKIEMHVPRSASLSIHVINGPIVIEDVTGPLRVTVVNGPISVRGAGTVLYLATTNGPVEAYISKITAQPDITISTTNGPIDVIVPKGFKAAVHATTVLGPVENDVAENSGPGTVSLETVNGPVSIGPP